MQLCRKSHDVLKKVGQIIALLLTDNCINSQMLVAQLAMTVVKKMFQLKWLQQTINQSFVF